MPNLRARGNGLFIEVTRTPTERKQAEKFAKMEQIEKENQELKQELAEIKEALGLNKEGK